MNIDELAVMGGGKYIVQVEVSFAVDLYRSVSKISCSFAAHLINVLSKLTTTGIHLT